MRVVPPLVIAGIPAPPKRPLHGAGPVPLEPQQGGGLFLPLPSVRGWHSLNKHKTKGSPVSIPHRPVTVHAEVWSGLRGCMASAEA